MSSFPEIRGKVTSKIDVVIRATQEEINLEEPFYAINWFSTKVEWLYHFYNFLAIRSVKKIGGIAFFKAKVTETILDDSNGRRDLILIVHYPGGQQFKSLMEATYFKMVSIFRILSVEKFTFGFTHKLVVDATSKKEDNLYYAIHHYKTNNDAKQTLQAIQAILPKEISIKYAGHVIATLNSQEKNKTLEPIPNLMDGLFIFQSSNEGSLQNLFSTIAYKNVLGTLQSSHISLLNRIAV